MEFHESYKRRTSRSEDILITEIRKVKDREGNVIQSREVDVPATVYTYHIHRRCKHCGYQDILSKEEKRKN